MTPAENGTDVGADPRPSGVRGRITEPLRWLRVRVPVTAMVVLAVSLGVAAFLAYELLLQDGLSDIDVVVEREEQRFERSITELLEDARAERPEAEPRSILESAVRRYLQLNPSTASYWTIVTFEDGFRLAASNGPPELESLFTARTLPAGELGTRQTLDTGTDAGAIRTSSVPISVDGERLATLQVVSPLEPVRADAREAAYLVAAAAGVSLLVGGALLAATLWRALSPLGSLAAAARSTELQQLSARVDVPSSDDEVSLLASEFNTMLGRLEASARQEQEFLASVGHELRTPITIARGHLELLTTVDRGDPAAVETTAAIVRDELGRMGRLVDDLMAIARVRTADFIRPRPLELVSWFEELELKITATPAGASTRVLPPPPVGLEADPDRLAQAILNLTSNAAIHTPGGTPITVAAQLDPDDRRFTLQVSDEGPGIDPDILDEVFAPFVRAGDARDSTGLGLAVVEAVVTAHGGDVEVSSGPQGTVVTLHLPWDRVTSSPTDRDPEHATGPSAEAG
ncbi:MAG: HAMP domain-containing sensor histidine kinase [Nitriliruptoraceae bacterium]